ncbi:4Fe-4S binding protein, partial [Bacteroidota bacterium]
TLLFFCIPIVIFAQESGQVRQPATVWDLLLSTKYVVGFLLAIIGLLIIWQNKLDNKLRIPLLIISFFTFAVYFGLHPSPICAFTKPFIYGLRTPFLAGIIFIGVLSVVSAKGFCGTICPAGALQELLYRLPILKKMKEKIVPFKISNSIRVLVSIAFLIVVLTTGITILAYFNLFELFHWNFALSFWDLMIFAIQIIIILAASLFLFRPFCYFICPVGLVTWLLENVSLVQMRLNKDKCTDCGNCEEEAPCPSVADIIKGKKLRADCHLCGMCMNSCPEDALYYGLNKK